MPSGGGGEYRLVIIEPHRESGGGGVGQADSPRIFCEMALNLWISDVLVILSMFRVGWGWLVGVDLVGFGDWIGKS